MTATRLTRSLAAGVTLALAGRRLRQGAGVLIAAVGVWLFLSRS